MRSTPAILGGAPAFPDGLPFALPARPPLEHVMQRLRPSYERGMLTNGPLVAELEQQVATRLGVPHVVAVSSCTSGLILAIRALAPDGGAAVLPSFTFSASAHAAAWNNLEVRFAECDPATFQLDPADAEPRLDGAAVLIPTHVAGAPCQPERFAELALQARVPLVFDAAHALGARSRGSAVGRFGDAEVFSLTPTKPLVAGEGGLVATRHPHVDEFLRWGRDYGNPGDYDTRFVGLNARMSELHAALALEGLREFDTHLARRAMLAHGYQDGLEQIPGLRPQAVDPDDLSTYKDFTITVDSSEYGVDRDALVVALRREGIDTRCYFWPPVHRQRAYAGHYRDELPVTVRLARSVVSLPIYPALSAADVERVTAVLAAVHERADDVARVATEQSTAPPVRAVS